MKTIPVVPLIFLCVFMLTASGCVIPKKAEEPVATVAELTEPAWIRNGEPLVFEGEDWFPTDNIESLLDSEVYQAGVYRDVVFFLEKADVRPFDRVYTHFGKNRYRAFEQ